MSTTNAPARNYAVIERKRGDGHAARMRSLDLHAENVMLPWIVQFGKDNGRFPTRREIRDGVKLSSVSLVNNRIDYLEKKGELSRKENGSLVVPGYRFELVEVPHGVTEVV